MSFKDYASKSKNYLLQLSDYLTGKTSAPTFTINIDPSMELNAIHNISSAEQLIQLSNGFYDQVAVKRSLIEIYKKPKDYLSDYQSSISDKITLLDMLDSNIDDQFISVNANKIKSQSIKSISSRLQLKLSLIKDINNA